MKEIKNYEKAKQFDTYKNISVELNSKKKQNVPGGLSTPFSACKTVVKFISLNQDQVNLRTDKQKCQTVQTDNTLGFLDQLRNQK